MNDTPYFLIHVYFVFSWISGRMVGQATPYLSVHVFLIFSGVLVLFFGSWDGDSNPVFAIQVLRRFSEISAFRLGEKLRLVRDAFSGFVQKGVPCLATFVRMRFSGFEKCASPYFSVDVSAAFSRFVQFSSPCRSSLVFFPFLYVSGSLTMQSLEQYVRYPLNGDTFAQFSAPPSIERSFPHMGHLGKSSRPAMIQWHLVASVYCPSFRSGRLFSIHESMPVMSFPRSRLQKPNRFDSTSSTSLPNRTEFSARYQFPSSLIFRFGFSSMLKTYIFKKQAEAHASALGEKIFPQTSSM